MDVQTIACSKQSIKPSVHHPFGLSSRYIYNRPARTSINGMQEKKAKRILDNFNPHDLPRTLDEG